MTWRDFFLVYVAIGLSRSLIGLARMMFALCGIYLWVNNEQRDSLAKIRQSIDDLSRQVPHWLASLTISILVLSAAAYSAITWPSLLLRKLTRSE